MIITEIKIGYYNNCEFLIKIIDFFVDNRTVYIIMEYYNQSDLKKFKQKKQINIYRKQIIYNILRGLQYLHINKIIHRDIKSENIMMNNDIAYIGDFGTCKILQENIYFTSTCIGTPYYLSPEIINGDNYNTKVDIYSLGCIFCELYYNKLPYTANNIYALYNNVQNNKKNIVISNTTQIGILINSMIDKDSFNRPLINDIIHSFSIQYGSIYNKLYKKDDKFYENIRKNSTIPKNMNEFKIILNKIKNISRS
jgi:serine/threonine protein kinase